MIEWLGSALHVPDALRNLFVGDRRWARRIHREMMVLTFWRNGIQGILERFACGKEIPDDTENLRRLVSASRVEVVAAEIYLEENRQKTVALFGADVADKIDYLIDINVGCGRLGESIDTHAAQGMTAEQARRLLRRIVQLSEAAQEVPSPSPVVICSGTKRRRHRPSQRM